MIQIVKLINGDEIIGEVEGDFSEFYNIYEPFNMTRVDVEQYGMGVKLDYILAYSQNNCVTIKNNSVIYNYKPSENLKNYYEKLVEYKNEHDPDALIKETIQNMEEMDNHYRKLISKRLIGGEDVN
jgi:hypothetical protein